MLWYFDTSALNALLDDGERGHLVSGLLAAGRPRASSFSIFELAATRDGRRRVALLTLVAQITEWSEPFEDPNAFTNRYLNNLAARAYGSSLPVESQDTSWNAIRWPERVTDEQSKTAAALLRVAEDWFDKVASNTREEVQRILTAEPATKLRTARDTLRYLMAPGRLFDTALAKLFQNVTGQELRGSLAGALRSDALARLHFGMFAIALHNRSVRESHYSRSRHAGGVDLTQAVYLPWVDRFVTNDRAQYRALRLLRVMAGTKRVEVQRYSEFRRRLLPVA